MNPFAPVFDRPWNRSLFRVVVPWIGVVWAIGSSAVFASDSEPKLADLVDQSAQHRRAFADLVGGTDPIPLEGTRSSLEIEIPLSPRIEVLGGVIEVLQHHSTGLEVRQSRLRLKWDDQEIGMAVLGEDDRTGRVGGRFSGTKEAVSSHFLRIAVDQSESERAKDLVPWTQIDTVGSWIALDYQLRPLDPMLDEMRNLIDERLWGDYELSILTAPRYAIGPDHLEWGSRVVQRAAIWMGDRPLAVRHDDRLTAGNDQIAIGTRAELLGILPKSISDQITSSFVGVYPHPDDSRHFLLVLSGTEPTGVERAVRAFAFSPDRLPALPRVDVTGWDAIATVPVARGRIESRRVQMPDLERWSTEGFPGATGGAVGAGCDLWVTDRDSRSLASAWMIAGKLAQVSGDVITTLTVTDRRPEPKRHWIAIGPVNSFDPELVGASPLERLGPADLAGRGVLTQFESPMRRGFAAGFLTADDPLLLRDRVHELIRPELWNSLLGDTVVWEVGGRSPRQQRLAATFEIGEPGWFLQSWRQLIGLPWISVLFAAGGVIILVWLVRQPMTAGADWDELPPRSNANRRVSRTRRLREAARRKARLSQAIRRGT